MKTNNINITIAVTLIFTAIIFRIGNNNIHLYNFVPIASIGLFSGAVIKSKKYLALLIPLVGQFLADTYFHFFTNTPGFYDGQWLNYIAIMSAALLGTTLKQIKSVNTLLYITGASFLFYIISNLSYFIQGYNGYTINGLCKTYIDAIPFFKNSFLSDMVCGILLFTGYIASQQLIFNKSKKIYG